MEQLFDVTAVEVIGGHRLRLTFEDGTVGDVDFSDRGVEWRVRAASRPCLLRAGGS
jgi:hypothetical protein